LRLRAMAPFLPNQSMKPMAPARYFAILLVTNPRPRLISVSLVDSCQSVI